MHNMGVLNKMADNLCESREIGFICNEIKRLFEIEKIIVFGVKRSENENTVTDVDICIVADTKNKNAWIKKAYIEIDSDIPFDIFLYTPSEWEALTQQSESFASRIARKGCVVYGKA